MSGGSEKAESPHDKQCDHCGLFYMDKGPSFTMHEAACEGDAESTEGATNDASDDGGGRGGLGVDSGETATGSTETSVSDTDDETEDCPFCGADTELTTEQGLEEGPYFQCIECGGQFEVTED